MVILPKQGQIYTIVDALDECPDMLGTPSAREEVLELVQALACLINPNVHLCVAGRPEIDIRKTREPLEPLQISLHDEWTKGYIKSVVYSEREMRSWREEDK